MAGLPIQSRAAIPISAKECLIHRHFVGLMIYRILLGSTSPLARCNPHANSEVPAYRGEPAYACAPLQACAHGKIDTAGGNSLYGANPKKRFGPTVMSNIYIFLSCLAVAGLAIDPLRRAFSRASGSKSPRSYKIHSQ